MTKRTKRLRTRSIEAMPSLSAERAGLITDFYQANDGLHSVPVMRALSFQDLCRKKSLYFGDANFAGSGLTTSESILAMLPAPNAPGASGSKDHAR